MSDRKITASQLGDVMTAIKAFALKLFSAPKTFSISVSAWTASTDPDFPFTAEISDSAVSASDLACVDFDKSSIKAASEASVITGETSEGKIALLAEKAPTTALSGVYRIIKGGVE